MAFTVKTFFKQFPNDDICLDAIMGARLDANGKMFCPGCGAESKFYRIEGRRAYACQWCGHHYYPCVGTPFEDSRTSLLSWFYAMFLFTSTRHGVPAKELQRQLGVTYKCAWRIGHQLRQLMASEAPEQLSGHVEVDESYHGGRKSGGKRGRGAPGKTILVGMVERDGNAKIMKAPNVRKATLRAIVNQNVEKGSRVSTDELASYNLLKNDGYVHGTVNHAAKEYVSGDIHVNSIEGFWSRLKLSIRGTHVHVSGKHLSKYAGEFSYRYNARKRPNEMFSDLVSAASERRTPTESDA
jgi:transposase-like protein